LRDIQDTDDARTPDSAIPSQLRPHITKKREWKNKEAGYHAVMKVAGLIKEADMDAIRGALGMETEADRKRRAAMFGAAGGWLSPGWGAALGAGAAEGGRSALGAGVGSALGAGLLGTAGLFPGGRRAIKALMEGGADNLDDAMKGVGSMGMLGGLGTAVGGTLGGAGGGYLATE
jgi:hypothetical protein